MLGLLGLLLVGPAPAQAAAPVRRSGPLVSSGGDPVTTGLRVLMTSISPSSLTPSSPVTVTGSIQNLDASAWTDLKVYLVMGSTPLTSAEALHDELTSPADSYSGDRIIDPGLFAELGDLPPGASRAYTLQVPFGSLGLLAPTPGVYPIGVHVIATDSHGIRNPVEATGRARSFIPLMPTVDPASRQPGQPTGQLLSTTSLSVVLPVRDPVVRSADGSYEDTAAILADISPGGRLRNLLDLAGSTGGVSISLLVDPAFLDAVRTLATGETGPPSGRAGGPAGSPATGAPTSPAASGGTASTLPTGTDTGANSASAPQLVAQNFLAAFRAVASHSTLLVEGYGGSDLVSLSLAGDRGLMHVARRISAHSLAAYGFSGAAVSTPVAVDAAALGDVHPRSLQLLGSDQVKGWTLTDGPGALLRTGGGALPVLIADSSLVQGGPAPGPTDTPLQVRQRLLSETALLALGHQPTSEAVAPSLLFFPGDSWDPGAGQQAAEFLPGLAASWITATNPLAQTPGRADPTTHMVAAAAPAVPAGIGAPLPAELLAAAGSIRRRAAKLASLTGGGHELLDYYEQSAALLTGAHWRTDPVGAQAVAQATASALSAQLDRVSVTSPDFVTLSSSSGRFPVTITNGLDRPVTVGVSFDDDSGILQIDDVRPIAIPPHQSETTTVDVNAPGIGVTGVTASLVTPAGQSFGTPATFTLRSSVVGVVIWIAMGAAAAFMLLVIVRRVVRRVRSPRAARPA